MANIHGSASDDKVFNDESPEVKELLAANPGLSLEAAIGDAIMNYEKSIAPAVAEAPAVEPEVKAESVVEPVVE